MFTLSSSMGAGCAWCLLLTSLLVFNQSWRHKEKKLEQNYKKRASWSNGQLYFVAVCVPKSATSCTENKRCLCPLQLTLPGGCTTIQAAYRHNAQNGWRPSLHLILSMRCTALHFARPVYPHANSTHTHCEFIYHPRRPADGMLPMQHMSTAACGAVYGVSANPHTSAKYAVAAFRLKSEWVSQRLRGAGDKKDEPQRKGTDPNLQQQPQKNPHQLKFELFQTQGHAFPWLLSLLNHGVKRDWWGGLDTFYKSNLHIRGQIPFLPLCTVQGCIYKSKLKSSVRIFRWWLPELGN